LGYKGLSTTWVPIHPAAIQKLCGHAHLWRASLLSLDCTHRRKACKYSDIPLSVWLRFGVIQRMAAQAYWSGRKQYWDAISEAIQDHT
jgi:hypothetical protein